MNGLMYRAVPGAVGTQSMSSLMTALIPARRMSPGSSGMHILSFVRAMRFTFISGLKIWISPSAVLYAFIPSNIIWA